MTKTKFVDSIIDTFFMIRDTALRHEKGLPFLKAIVLHFINEYNNPPMKEIARHMKVTMPSATSFINDLVKTGLVKRVSDTKDRRVIRVMITPKGKKLLFKQIQIIVNEMKKKLSLLSYSEQKKLFQIVKKLCASQK